MLQIREVFLKTSCDNPALQKQLLNKCREIEVLAYNIVVALQNATIAEQIPEYTRILSRITQHLQYYDTKVPLEKMSEVSAKYVAQTDTLVAKINTALDMNALSASVDFPDEEPPTASPSAPQKPQPPPQQSEPLLTAPAGPTAFQKTDFAPLLTVSGPQAPAQAPPAVSEFDEEEKMLAEIENLLNKILPPPPSSVVRA